MGKSLNGKELGQGISQRKDGLYQARFTNRFGKRQTIYSKSITELRTKLRDEQYEDSNELNVIDNEITLNEWFDKYMKVHSPSYRPNTISNYIGGYNRVKEDLGWRVMKDINVITFQELFNKLTSDASRKNTKKVLMNLYKYALDCNIVKSINPIQQVKTKLTDVGVKIRVLTREETKLFLENGENIAHFPLFELALETGMRIGEICGLQWEDIDFEHKMIYVRHTLTYAKKDGLWGYEFQLNEPKTENGIIKIPMTKKAEDLLLEQHSQWEKINNRCVAAIGYENLVYITKRNTPICTRNTTVSIRRIEECIRAKGIDFEPITPHTLRHTFATRCLENGMNVKTLQRILGHSDIRTTMNTYCHVTDDELYSAMNIFEEKGILNTGTQIGVKVV